MKMFRRATAAVALTLVLIGYGMPHVSAREVVPAGSQISSKGEWSMLSGLGLGILCAGGLTALITTQGRRK